MRYLTVVFLLLFPHVVTAETKELRGAFGIELGQALKLDDARLLNYDGVKQSRARELGYLKSYSVKPPKKHPYFDYYSVTTSKDDIIVSIYAHGLVSILFGESCEERQKEISQYLEKKYRLHSKNVSKPSGFNVVTLMFANGRYKVEINCNIRGTRLSLYYEDVASYYAIEEKVKDKLDRHSSL